MILQSKLINPKKQKLLFFFSRVYIVLYMCYPVNQVSPNSPSSKNSALILFNSDKYFLSPIFFCNLLSKHIFLKSGKRSYSYSIL